MTASSGGYMDIPDHMQIAIITQRLNPDDYVFGFFYGHVVDIARACERVEVVCLECSSSAHGLPDNVHVHSLGKEKGEGRWMYLWRFLRFVVHERRTYDTVLVHMEPMYVLLGWLPWFILRKRVVLWYNHVYSDWKLKVASLLVNQIIGVSRYGIPVSHPNTVFVTYEKDLAAHLTEK